MRATLEMSDPFEPARAAETTQASGSPLALRFVRGAVHLPRLGLWLDARDAKPDRVFVSHGHTDHLGAHREVILSHPTAQFMHARVRGERVAHTLAFGEPARFEFEGQSFQITLLPAGHILGSAMALIEAGGESLLYTGDFKLRPGQASEACAPCHADYLVMETTFGRPRYQFPPADAVWRAVIEFCRETLARGETAVLLAYSLGKCQETLRGLAGAGLPLMVHEQAWRMTQIYEQFTPPFPPYAKYDAAAVRGKVLLCPPMARTAKLLHAIGPARTAVLTGWVLDSSCRFQYGTDAAFPLSDHADFPELIEFVERVKPRKVHTLHGFAADFAWTLRQMGWDAQPLEPPSQLELALEPGSRDGG